ncbi:MAG: Fe-S cluster assembly protein SufB [Candidatus Micrarchaeia archaeon]
MFSRSVVEQISKSKKEPAWMLNLRLKAYDAFVSKPMPSWQVPDISVLDFDDMSLYNPVPIKATDWADVPKDIRRVYEDAGIIRAECNLLGGSVAQYMSESVYERIRQDFEKQGVIFCSMDEAVRRYPSLVRKHFTKVVPIDDNKFSALHYALWSGGTFLYVPDGVNVSLPMHAYFYMKEKGEGQFEHTLIIAGEGSKVHYIEGCTALAQSKYSLHSAVVEVIAGNNSHVRYTTVQNWSKNIYNLNTKRAVVYDGAVMEWVGGSLGAKVSMLYPSSILVGRGACATHLAITVAQKGTVKESGAKVIHMAPSTKSKVSSRSICIDDGHSVYRGLVDIGSGARGAVSNVDCNSLLIGARSMADTFPYSRISEHEDVHFAHEATTTRISQQYIDYAMCRGISKEEAILMYVNGFIEPILREIPLEYAIELNNYIRHYVEGSEEAYVG